MCSTVQCSTVWSFPALIPQLSDLRQSLSAGKSTGKVFCIEVSSVKDYLKLRTNFKICIIIGPLWWRTTLWICGEVSWGWRNVANEWDRWQDKLQQELAASRSTRDKHFREGRNQFDCDITPSPYPPTQPPLFAKKKMSCMARAFSVVRVKYECMTWSPRVYNRARSFSHWVYDQLCGFNQVSTQKPQTL